MDNNSQTCHTRFPHPNPLPEGEGINERLREFHVEAKVNPVVTGFIAVVFTIGYSDLKHRAKWKKSMIAFVSVKSNFG